MQRGGKFRRSISVTVLHQPRHLREPKRTRILQEMHVTRTSAKAWADQNLWSFHVCLLLDSLVWYEYGLQVVYSLYLGKVKTREDEWKRSPGPKKHIDHWQPLNFILGLGSCSRVRLAPHRNVTDGFQQIPLWNRTHASIPVFDFNAWTNGGDGTGNSLFTPCQLMSTLNHP